MSASIRVLVVDADAVTRRLFELTLGAQAGWTVESTRDGAGALDVLRTEMFDVLLVERNLPDMTGLQLHRRLMQEERLKTVPFLILSSDAKLEHRVVALRAGVDDYLLKPVAPEDLRARLESIVGRWRRSREARPRRYLLAGDFSVLAFPDLVSTLALQRRTGTISINAPTNLAEVFLSEGEVVHATFGTLAGVEAFNALFHEPHCQFEFTPTATAAEQRTITGSVVNLIMEATRLVDERARLPVPVPVRRPAVTPVPPGAEHPPQRLAQAFAAAFTDQFSLGELFLWTGPELSAWSRREFPERLHIHLVTELSLGISALLPLASPPSERQMMAALRGASKLPGLVYFLRNERVVDVVGLDLESPLVEAHSLRRNPTITIVAPPRGDPLEIGPRAQVGLRSLFKMRPPACVVGVGNPNLEALFANILDPTTKRAVLPGAIGEPDFREVLGQAVARWGQA